MNPVPTLSVGPLAFEPSASKPLPTQFDLPCEDGAVENALDLDQSGLLKETLLPVLNRLHPDGNFSVVHDMGIYYEFDVARKLARVIVPDWCYIPGLKTFTGGIPRRSFVMWDEEVTPVVALEYVSGNGREERDRTPETGKFWIYEQKVRPVYYGIYEINPSRIEMYRLVNGRFEPETPNAQGRFPIAPLGVELGIWHGVYQGSNAPWMRWFDPAGSLLLTGREEDELTHRRADAERARNDRLAAKLRELGIDPDQV